MENKNIFSGIEEKEMDKILKALDTKPIEFLKNRTIITNTMDKIMIGILLSGTANVEKYDYDGNRFILEKLEKNSVFGEVFSRFGGDISVVATSDCEVLLFEYSTFINKNKNRLFLTNMFELLSQKIVELNIRIDILSKRSIRDKLLTYFLVLTKDNPSQIFTLPFTYTDLADYLCVDRSAMMREIKKMKELGILKTKGRKIKLFS